MPNHTQDSSGSEWAVTGKRPTVLQVLLVSSLVVLATVGCSGSQGNLDDNDGGTGGQVKLVGESPGEEQSGDSQSPAAEPTVRVNRVAHFPQHLEDIETNRGFPRYGALILRDGCLRFGIDAESSGGNLLVWPAGFSFDDDGDTVRVMDHTGRVVAHVGDHIRITSIRNIWEPLPEPVILLINGQRIAATASEETLERLKPLRPENHPWLPSECSGASNAKIVGDEVTAYIPDVEPTIVPIPGSTLFFPRHSSIWHVLEHQLLGRNGRLVLEGDCLRLGPGGYLLVWPPGFTPHIEDGAVSVRNGGGRTVARVGETIGVVGNSGPDYPGRCASGGSYQIHELTIPRQGG